MQLMFMRWKALSLQRQNGRICGKVPASVSVVTAKEIKDHSYQSVAQALGQETGVYLSPVADGGISLRGFSSSDVLVLVDGQPVNSGWNGSVDKI